jgi:hypothetical protein
MQPKNDANTKKKSREKLKLLWCYEFAVNSHFPFCQAQKKKFFFFVDLETIRVRVLMNCEHSENLLELKKRHDVKCNLISTSAHSFDGNSITFNQTYQLWNFIWLTHNAKTVISSSCFFFWVLTSSQLCVPIIYGFYVEEIANWRESYTTWNFHMLQEKRGILTWLLDLLHFTLIDEFRFDSGLFFFVKM